MNLLKYFLRTTQFYLFIILTNLFFSNNRDFISSLITLLLLRIGVSHPEGGCILFPGNSGLDFEGPWSL